MLGTESGSGGERPDSSFQSIVHFAEKGCNYTTFPNFIQMVCRDLDSWGYKRVRFRSDGENLIKAVLRRVREAWNGEVVLESSAEGDHQSNGSGECSVGLMKGQVRALKFALESRLQCCIQEDHNLLAF